LVDVEGRGQPGLVGCLRGLVSVEFEASDEELVVAIGDLLAVAEVEAVATSGREENVEVYTQEKRERRRSAKK
jgi:hypothetical protein